jgi:hypothetical protein
VTPSSVPHHAAWPALPHAGWSDTIATLHRWTQIVGKIRLERTPWINHSWHVPLYLTTRGLGTSPMRAGDRSFELNFDFQSHCLEIRVSDGVDASIPLMPRSVADFHEEVTRRLESMDLGTPIHTTPSEIPDGTPFEDDHEHASYDVQAVFALWRALLDAHHVFTEFRARFVGKVSPVHFFWGSFDLAVTRFSGREAPPHPAGIPALPDWVAREAYSHEVSSLGFWPGNAENPTPVFYSYAYPNPEGFADARVGPDASFWFDDLGEFLLPYDAVRGADDPAATLLEFAQDTYEAAAELGDWDRDALEWPGGAQGPERG